jgi:hypothetical protein
LDWLAQQPLQDTSFIVDIANQQRLTEEAIERYCPKQPFYANLSLKPKTMKVYGASPGIIELCHQVGIPLTRIANDLRGPCPLCQEQSMDTHRDNLSIKANGTAFNCMEGGPGATHSAKEVYKKLLELRKSF